MLTNVTRGQVIQVWVVVVGLIAAASIAFGPNVTMSTGFVLVALAAVPPVVLLMLWPGPQPPTASEVLRGDDR